MDEAYRDQAKWTRMSIMATAGSAFFSSDRTIQQYANEIWHVTPCQVCHMHVTGYSCCTSSAPLLMPKAMARLANLALAQVPSNL